MRLQYCLRNDGTNGIFLLNVVTYCNIAYKTVIMKIYTKILLARYNNIILSHNGNNILFSDLRSYTPSSANIICSSVEPVDVVLSYNNTVYDDWPSALVFLCDTRPSNHARLQLYGPLYRHDSEVNAPRCYCCTKRTFQNIDISTTQFRTKMIPIVCKVIVSNVRLKPPDDCASSNARRSHKCALLCWDYRYGTSYFQTSLGEVFRR